MGHVRFSSPESRAEPLPGPEAPEPLPPLAHHRRAALPLLKPVVLLVEDDALCRAGLRRHLVKAGFDVCEAADGMEGLRQLLRWRIDVVVTDLKMPVLGGRALVGLAARASPTVPVVAITGMPHVPARTRRLLGRRGIELLGKPFGAEELTAAIRRAMERPEGGRSG